MPEHPTAPSPTHNPPVPQSSPPPLPPRPTPSASNTITPLSAPTARHPDFLTPLYHPSQSSSTLAQDARSSSQASLGPPLDPEPTRRRQLLLIYIHGFMGDETSFQSFPAHLQNVLTVTLSGEGSAGNGEDEGHLVHTKVYPKFATRHPIQVATQNLSQWLGRFESGSTDVVLLGHSMGGLLAAELVLLPSPYVAGRRKHRILGIVAFDAPFLGMHPGVIGAGIASLFRPAPPPPPANPDVEVDEFFDQTPKRNFTIIPSRKQNQFDSTLHFITKHHARLTQATGKYLMSHLEFGACLGDPVGLKKRYQAIRQLEDGVRTPEGDEDRVRFINYYTVSFGRHKDGKPPSPPLPVKYDCSDYDKVESLPVSSESKDHPNTSLSRPSTSGHSGSSSQQSTHQGLLEAVVPNETANEEPSLVSLTASLNFEDCLPPSPAPPAPLNLPEDLSYIEDRVTREAVEKEHKQLREDRNRQQKEYEKAIGQWQKAKEKLEMEDAAKVSRDEKHPKATEQRKIATTEPQFAAEQGRATQGAPSLQKKKRERKFCITPSGGDRTWAKVEMRGVDEVGAHCGLFFVGEVYERLVGDVAATIEEWVGEERSRRLVESSR